MRKLKVVSTLVSLLLLVNLLLPAASLAVAPTITLVAPTAVAPATPTLQSGAANQIQVNAVSAGSTISSVQWQSQFAGPAGAFTALEIFAPIPLVVAAPTAGAGARADTTAAPAAVLALPGAIFAFDIIGVVSAVNAATGEIQVGTPPIFTYQSAATIVRGTVRVGDQVRVVGNRTLAPGPIVAEVVTVRTLGPLPPAAPTVLPFFLFNGTVLATDPSTWRVGAAPPGVAANFIINDPIDPAAIDAGLGQGSLVTVQFAVPAAPVGGAAINIAAHIDPQAAIAVGIPIAPAPRADTTPVPIGLPVGTVMEFVVDGVVNSINAATGEWQIGSQPVFVYRSAATRVDGVPPPAPGDLVRVIARRTLAAGPLVVDRITPRTRGPLPVDAAVVTTAFLFNGPVEAVGVATWTVGGVVFVVNDPAVPAAITAPAVVSTPLSPNLVTVAFTVVGGTPPASPAAWSPMTRNAVSGLWEVNFTPLAVVADQNGVLLFRATNLLGEVTETSFAVRLLAPTAVPGAPTLLVAAVVSPIQVNLSWTDNSLNESSFRVERATDALFTLNKVTFTVGPNIRTYNDTSAAPGATLSYRVFAVNLVGDSLPSNVQTVTTTGLPGVTLVAPAAVPPALPLLQSGAGNLVKATATAPGSTVANVQWQTQFTQAAGALIAVHIDPQVAIGVGVPIAGAGARADATAAPPGLPVGSIANFVIDGVVSAVNLATGEFQVGTPPVFVYQSATTVFRRNAGIAPNPAVGDLVKVVASRTLAPGPIVADVITVRALAPQPAAAPVVGLAFVFNGAVQNITPQVWTIGGSNFIVDDPATPATIAPGLIAGSLVTVEFTVVPPPPPIAGGVAMTALEIFAQIPLAIEPTLSPAPRLDATLANPAAPAGSVLMFVIIGTVKAVNPATGEWQIGDPPVFVYQGASTIIDGVAPRPPVVGDEVRIIAKRSLTPGPVVAERITRRGAGGLLAAPLVEVFYLFNGNVGVAGAATWTVGGVSFVVNDPVFPAAIDPGIAAGTAVTVEFSIAGGPPAASPAAWQPMTRDPVTGRWQATVNPAAVPANQNGLLFFKVTDALGGSGVTQVPVALVASLGTAPLPAGGLTAVPTSVQVILSWIAPAPVAQGQTGFRIERAADSAFTLNVVATPLGLLTNTFADTAITVGATYSYRVFAVNGPVDSLASNVVTVSIPAPTAAVAPAPAPVTGGGVVAPPVVGGGGAVVAPPPAAPPAVAVTGLTAAAPLTLDANGRAVAAATIQNTAGTVVMNVAPNTLVTGPNRQPLAGITAAPLTTPPVAPPNRAIVFAYTLGPSGAQFNPPISLTMSYNPATLPPGVKPTSLVVAFWDGSGWVSLGGKVNTANNTITVDVSHFTEFAIIGDVEAGVAAQPTAPPAPPTVPPPPPSPAAKPTTAPAVTKPAAPPSPKPPVATPAPKPEVTAPPATKPPSAPPVVTPAPPTAPPVIAPPAAPAPEVPAVAPPAEAAPVEAMAGTNWPLLMGIIAAVIIAAAAFYYIWLRKPSEG
ncbi:MAG: fibronectin type III domain-containing protein [Chloroflexi bacterium]|nr:fibronectin type III domain-containing protein [Chloroflexota bacterium]